MGFLPTPAATEEEAQRRRERAEAQAAYEAAYAKTLAGRYEVFRNAAREFRDTFLDTASELFFFVVVAGLMLGIAAGIATAYVWLFR